MFRTSKNHIFCLVDLNLNLLIFFLNVILKINFKHALLQVLEFVNEDITLLIK